MLRIWGNAVFSMLAVLFGAVVFMLFRRTPARAHEGMINLFCLTRGASNDVMSKAIGTFQGVHQFSNVIGVLGEMTAVRRAGLSQSLRENGFYVFESRLADEACDRLLSFATTQSCVIRPMDNSPAGSVARGVYKRESPLAVRYDFRTQDLLNNRDVQELLADLSFAVVAQDYLGSRPVMDVLSMWWHTDFSETPDKEAAQFFHFDMDRPKWLKFFIYLTDVESTNGPHTFISGSHKTGEIPERLLKKGYSRITDEEVGECFGPERFEEFSAPRGTIIAEDTRGLHKGKHVEHGDRLVLQLQFSNSLFGAKYEKATIGGDVIDRLRARIDQYPSIYSAYL